MRLFRKLRALFRSKQAERDLDDELQYHLEQRIGLERDKGLSAEEARAAALRSMEGLSQKKEECRDLRVFSLLEGCAQDLRYAVRTLNKNRSFAAVAVLSLALGIGANTAIFSLMDALLLRPLPVPESQNLIRIEANRGDPQAQTYLTYPIFEQIRDRNDFLAGTFTWSDHWFQMLSGSEMTHVNGALASGGYFRTLGVQAEIGRVFTPENDQPEGGKDGPVAVISDAFWTSHFQRSPAAVGAGITLDGVRFTIIGVMPRGFFGADVGMHPQIWAPLSLAARLDSPGCITSRSCWWLIVMGRRKHGISLQQANARLAVLSPQMLRDTLPDWDSAGQKRYLGWRFQASSGANGWTSLRGTFNNPLAVLMILVGIVLLIACANMANLLLARASARQREIAVRMAMGAGRGRVIRQLLTESLLLAILGGAAGLAFASWSAKLLVSFLTSTQRLVGQDSGIQLDLHPDWRVMLFTLLAALLCGLIFGLAPALRATRGGAGAALKERTASLQTGRAGTRLGKVILGVQAALSVLLVSGAGLFAGSLWHLLTLHPGFNPDNVMLISVDTAKRPEKGAALARLYQLLLERAQVITGVKAASAVWMTPLSNGGWDQYVKVPGRPDLTQEQTDTYMNLIGERYFEVMQTPVLAGREFNAADSGSSDKVGILNSIAARRFFPGGNALGSHVEVNGKPIRIIGVVGNAKYLNLQEAAPPTLYFPFMQSDQGNQSMTILLKIRGNIAGIYPAFHDALRDVAPGVPIRVVKMMRDQVDDSLGRERLLASLSVFFGVLALLLTSVGLYGVLAYSVTRRTGEIGIRMALGAQRRNVVLLVVRETFAHVVAGIAVGVMLVLLLSKLVAGLLYGIQPNDPGNLVLAVGVFLVVAAGAAYLPARRASGLDPMMALREE